MFQMLYFVLCSNFEGQELFSPQTQSRVCGKGVDLGLFPSDSLEFQSYNFDALAHIELLMV